MSTFTIISLDCTLRYNLNYKNRTKKKDFNQKQWDDYFNNLFKEKKNFIFCFQSVNLEVFKFLRNKLDGNDYYIPSENISFFL